MRSERVFRRAAEIDTAPRRRTIDVEGLEKLVIGDEPIDPGDEEPFGLMLLQ